RGREEAPRGAQRPRGAGGGAAEREAREDPGAARQARGAAREAARRDGPRWRGRARAAARARRQGGRQEGQGGAAAVTRGVFAMQRIRSMIRRSSVAAALCAVALTLPGCDSEAKKTEVTKTSKVEVKAPPTTEPEAKPEQPEQAKAEEPQAPDP